MSTTLVSFLGRGRKEASENSRPGYREIAYRFPASGDQPGPTHTTALFGEALLKYLREHRGDQVARWVVLGTSGSMWSELIHVLPKERHDELLEPYSTLDDKWNAEAVDTTDLEHWKAALDRAGIDIELVLCLTGKMLDDTSHRELCRVLFETVPAGATVVFDITHGFRHQPVIASFVVGLMRRTHQLQGVRFYSGVMEAMSDGVAPVVELPTCEEVLCATERAAVYATTGNYAALGRDESATTGQLGEQAQSVWFHESTNQMGLARSKAHNLHQMLDRNDVAATPIEEQMRAMLRQAIDWQRGHKDLSGRYRTRANDALKVGDYLKATLLAYEAVICRGLELLRPKLDVRYYDAEAREQAKNEIKQVLPAQKLKSFRALADLRNAVAHGSIPKSPRVQRLLRDSAAYERAIRRGTALVDELAMVLPSDAAK